MGLGKKTDLLTLPLRGSSRTQSRKTLIFFLKFCHHNVVLVLFDYLVSLDINFGGAKQILNNTVEPHLSGHQQATTIWP